MNCFESTTLHSTQLTLQGTEEYKTLLNNPLSNGHILPKHWSFMSRG